MLHKTLVLIFSRNRAMQLDGVLRSFFVHCQDPEYASIHIIYQATNSEFEAQYIQLKKDYTNHQVIFVQEENFYRDVLRTCYEYEVLDHSHLQRVWVKFLLFIKKTPRAISGPEIRKFILFLVDDNIFVQDFFLYEMMNRLQNHPEALGYSLRLGLNINYVYTMRCPQELPDFSTHYGNLLVYSWVNASLDFGYPLEVSSSLYRLNELLLLLEKIRFKNPNELEGYMAAHANEYSKYQSMLMCSKQSVTFCNPINIVQVAWENPAGQDVKYSSQNLANLFDQGFRINVEAYSGFVPNSCHQEVPLNLINLKGS